MVVATIRNKIKRFGALMTASGVIAASLLAPLPVMAAPLGPDDTTTDPNYQYQAPSTTTNQAASDNSTADLANKKINTNDCKYPYGQLNKDNCGIIKYVVVLTNILSALVGVVIVISITWAGIQYSMSKSDPQAVVAARSRITNGIIALVVYIFMVAFLQWVVPGGIF